MEPITARLRDGKWEVVEGERVFAPSLPTESAARELAADLTLQREEYVKKMDAMHEKGKAGVRHGRAAVKPPVEVLAKRFSEILRKWLTPKEWDEMVRRNTHDAVYEDYACASQDFCDANVAMGEAWGEVIGGEMDPGSDAHAAMWNLAWEIARREYLGDPSWRTKK